MSDDTNNPFLGLGTLTAQILGVVAILAREVVRNKAVDVDRLQNSLEAFWEQDLAEQKTDGERRMVESVRKVIQSALEQGASDVERD